MESNDRPENEARTLREQFEELVAYDEAEILSDIATELRSLRAFVLGGVRDGRRWPQGRLGLCRRGRVLQCTLSLDDFELVGYFENSDWHKLWHDIDRALEQKTVAWDRSWKAKQRERQQFVSAVRGRS